MKLLPNLQDVYHYFAFRDGVWDQEEIEAIYGVHHVYSQKKSKVWSPKLLRVYRALTSW